MPLNDKKIQAAKPQAKPYKMYDGDGLFLYISTTGTKSWRIKYMVQGKCKEMTLGQYPVLSLVEARIRRNKAFEMRVDGVDPAADKQAKKREEARQEREESLTFAKVAEDFCRVHSSKVGARTIKNIKDRLRLYVLPFVGNTPFAKLTFDDLKGVALKLEQSGKQEMAYRVAVIINQICRYAKLNQWSAHNIADGITAVIAKRPKSEIQGRPAITDLAGVATMLKKLDAYMSSANLGAAMAAALQLFPLLALRAQELLEATWPEVDFDAGVLSIPAVRMKCGKSHDVPLPRQAIAILKDLHNRRVNNSFIFRSGSKHGHLTGEAVNKAMHWSGIPLGEMCLHGWRKVFSTICHESGAPAMLVEKCLAHVSGDAVAMTYNKAQYHQARRILMQWWADTIDALRDGTERPRLELERAAMFA